MAVLRTVAAVLSVLSVLFFVGAFVYAGCMASVYVLAITERAQ